jgi:hypothetical protein
MREPGKVLLMCFVRNDPRVTGDVGGALRATLASGRSSRSAVLAQPARAAGSEANNAFAYDFRLGTPDVRAFPYESWRRLSACGA